MFGLQFSCSKQFNYIIRLNSVFLYKFRMENIYKTKFFLKKQTNVTLFVHIINYTKIEENSGV